MATNPLEALEALRRLGEAAKARIDTEAEVQRKADSMVEKAKNKVREARGADARDAAREDLRQAQADAARLVEEIMWEPEALVYRVVAWTCKCDADYTQAEPVGLFTRYFHRKGHGIRYVAVKPGNTWPDLPRMREQIDREIDLCPYCTPDMGFVLEGEEEDEDEEDDSIPGWQIEGEAAAKMQLWGGGWLQGEEELLWTDLTQARAPDSSEEPVGDEEESSQISVLPDDLCEEHF